MLVFYKTTNVRGKCNISLPIFKEERRLKTIKIKKITKENKQFLRDIGLKLN